MCCTARWDEVCPLLAGGIKRNEEGTVGRERKRERVVHRLVIVGTRSFTLLNNEQRNTAGFRTKLAQLGSNLPQKVK